MSGAEKFYDAITQVREDLVEETLDYRFAARRNIPWQRYAGLAACLALVVCIGYLAANLRMGGMNAATGNGGGDNSAAAGEAAGDTGESTISDGAAPEDSDTTGDSAMPPPNDAGGGTGEAVPVYGSTVPALGFREAVEGVTAGRTLTLEFDPTGTVYATDVYILTNTGTEPLTVSLAFDETAASCTADGITVESGAQVSLLKAGASTELILRSKAAVEGDTLPLDSPVNLTVTEAALVLRNLPEGTVVSGAEPFDQIIRE